MQPATVEPSRRQSLFPAALLPPRGYGTPCSSFVFPLLPLRPRFRLSLAHPLPKPIFGGGGAGGRVRLLGALGVATTGRSMLIAQSGISGVGEVYKPATRAEVRARFGEADETGTCPDGRGMERRSIRRQVKWRCSGFAAEMGLRGAFGRVPGEHGAG